MTFTDSLGAAIRNVVTPVILPLIEQNIVPDAVVRLGMRKELAYELNKVKNLSSEEKAAKTRDFVAQLKTMPIAINQKEANDQHYEVPDEFYQMVLGPHLKYSSGYWPNEKTTMEESEVAMLEIYCERAGLFDGMHLIDLGCGWGSVSLYMAKKYPKSTITSVSNSNSQREYIMRTAESRGLQNITVHTGDINEFDLPKETHYGQADRVISIEMFEHMKNYQKLMAKISNWMKPDAKLFVHIFTSMEPAPGHFKNGWMADTFFTGGTLPSDNLLLFFQDDLAIENHWIVNGTHYQKTLEGWCQIMDGKKAQVLPVLAKSYGEKDALKRFVSWRLFFIACAEFFGMCGGEEYLVSHYLFRKR